MLECADDEAGTTPSRDNNIPPGDNGVSVLMINSRRPGAGLHGAVEGGSLFSALLCPSRYRNSANVVSNRSKKVS